MLDTSDGSKQKGLAHMSIIPQKHCSKCKRMLPATDEYFGCDPKMSSGFKSRCKECLAQIAHKKNVERGAKLFLRSDKDGYKVCTKCHEEKPATSEYFTRHESCYLGFASICKTCMHKKRFSPEGIADHNARERKRYAENPEWHEKIHLKNTSEKNKKQHRERHQIRYATDPDYRESVREASRRKYAKNPERQMLATVKYRAKKQNLPNSLTRDEWENTLEHFHHSCAVCGRQLRDLFGTHTVAQDHWIPLISPDCPGTVAHNMIPLCHGSGGCNNKKNRKDPLLWLIETYGKRKGNAIFRRIDNYLQSKKK